MEGVEGVAGVCQCRRQEDRELPIGGRPGRGQETPEIHKPRLKPGLGGVKGLGVIPVVARDRVLGLGRHQDGKAEYREGDHHENREDQDNPSLLHDLVIAMPSHSETLVVSVTDFLDGCPRSWQRPEVSTNPVAIGPPT